MKISPIEIRQKQFEKKTFGGIDKDEVQAFLNSLSIAWEKMQEDQAGLRARVELAEKEVQKLREVESSLYKTLKTAEDTSQKAIDQANQQAKLIVQEAKLKAETLHQEARWKASKAMEQAEEYARKSYDQMVSDVKVLEKELRNIENLKDHFLSDIKIIAQDLLEKAEKANQRSASIQFKVPPAPNLETLRPPIEEPKVPSVSDSDTAHEEPVTSVSEVKVEAMPEEVVENFDRAEPAAHMESIERPEDLPSEEEGSFFDRIK